MGKNVGGRPAVVFDKNQTKDVEKLAACLTVSQIADFFDISESTFLEVRRRQPEVSTAYKRGKAKAIANAGAALYKRAIGGSDRLLEFYLKTQGGWRENMHDDSSDDPIGSLMSELGIEDSSAISAYKDGDHVVDENIEVDSDDDE